MSKSWGGRGPWKDRRARKTRTEETASGEAVERVIPTVVITEPDAEPAVEREISVPDWINQPPVIEEDLAEILPDNDPEELPEVLPENPEKKKKTGNGKKREKNREAKAQKRTNEGGKSDMSHTYNICLDIGGTKVLGAIFDENREVVYRLKKKTKESGDSTANVEEVIVSVVDEMIEASGIKKKQINAIAAGAPGVIDQDRGVVLFSPNLPWRDYDIKTPLEKKFGVPFHIGNDVNVGVLGEYRYGAAKGYKNVVGLFVGTGMGGGLILDGKLFTGNQFKAAEYGHMILDPEGPLCNCGQRGCLEAFSSKQGMSAYIKQQVARGRTCMMADAIEGSAFKSKMLKKSLAAGDAVVTEAVDRACHWLAVATGNLINTFSPDVVIYGGGVIEACGETFLEKISAEVDRYCMPSIRSSVELKNASLGDDSVIYGALAMIEE